MKVCTKCDATRPLSAFRAIRRGTGTHSWCKVCESEVAGQRQMKRTPYECHDCGRKHRSAESYRIDPPDDDAFRLCADCWDRIIYAAILEAVR